MFPQLPEEIERMIWKMYYSSNVLDDIRNRDTIWMNPSLMLFVNTSDIGAVQIDHSDLERRYDCDSEPHCETLRMVLNYPLSDGVKCEECWYDKRGWCSQEYDDEKFEKLAYEWWNFDHYEEFPELYFIL